MSNYEAGKLYEAVIDEVITDSRQDFEDSGIDESTLQDLKRLWCEKLSQMKVCNFAWDDEDQELQVQQTILGANVRGDNLHLNSGLEMPNLPYDSGLNSIHNGNIAGSSDGTYSMGIEIPTIKQEFNDDTGLIIPKVNQSDGAFELTVEMDSTNAAASIKKMKSKLRSQADGAGVGDEEEDEDDIFNDSDDINSDLDDDLDSEKSDDDDAEQEGRIMLCLYDKVQRVKNKWKCSLKEGIANIEGRDFVFQRATGESEW